jgi:chemotaxis protein methyltransferase WspC
MGAADFENLLKVSMGLNAASIGPSAIERAVRERLAACNLEDPQAYWEHLGVSDTELQELIEAVVVPETWFFRDSESFAALARLVREEWLRMPWNGVLCLLSLPCSSGEEPYSMAMALLDASIPADRFRVDAVDISTRALAQAGRAVYGRNSFRGHELGFRDRHLETTAQGYRVSETVRQQVRLQQGNLFAADFLPGVEVYDVIFCRNVLIYFDRATQDRAIVVLTRLLKAKGVLFVAPAETALPSAHGFVSTNLPLAFAFRRAAAGPAKARKAPEPVRRPAAPRPQSKAVLPLHRARATSAVRAAASAAGVAVEKASDIGEAMRLADQGHFVEAATCCAEHLRRHGPSGTAFYLMGLVRDATGNQPEAVSYYRKALYLEPNHGEAQIHLALLMEKQGDTAGAQVLRNRARRLEQQSKTSHE